MTTRIVLLAALVTACSKDGSRKPANAGVGSHECKTVGAPAGSARQRARWSIDIKDQHGKQAAKARVELTYAVADGIPSAEQTCIDVENVRPEIAVDSFLRAADVDHQPQGAAAIVQVELHVRAPARVEDGRRLNYPEARLAWSATVTANGVSVAPRTDLMIPTFRPKWQDTTLVTEVSSVGVEAAP